MPDKDLFGPAPKKEEFVAAELVVEGKLTIEEIAKKSGLALDRVKAVMSIPQIRGYFSKHLDDAGATLEASARVIADAHKARKLAVVSYMGEGRTIDAGIDFGTRLTAAELNLKVRGELREAGQSINLFMDLSDDQLAKIAAGELDPASLIDVGPRIVNPASAAVKDEEK